MKISRAIAVIGAGFVLVLGTSVWLAYQHDLRRERLRIAEGSQVIATRCGPIEFAALGRGPAVLLVHGAGGGFDQTLGIARDLAAHGYRAIAMSRFGYLRTPLPADASPAAQADAHACLLDALGIERAAIVGVSAGAPSSMQFALRHAQRTSGLVLLVPLAYAPRPPAELSAGARFMYTQAIKSDFLYWAALRAAPAVVVRTILATPPEVFDAADAREQGRAHEVMRHILPLSERQAGLLNDAAVAAALTRYPLERVAAPALVVSLKDDLYGTYESARYTAVQLSGARFVGFASGGHAWLGHHDEIMAHVVAFLGGRDWPADPE
jgi:pimeloyl-ACP methyl ester carboxylesterase